MLKQRYPQRYTAKQVAAFLDLIQQSYTRQSIAETYQISIHTLRAMERGAYFKTLEENQNVMKCRLLNEADRLAESSS